MWFLTLDLATLLIQFWLFPPIFGSIKIELSGNTIWPQASGLQKIAKLNGYVNFFQLKNYLNEMRHFPWFSNTVLGFKDKF